MRISDDPTRATWDVPATVGKYLPQVQSHQQGGIPAQVIYTIAPSHVDANRIWIGTDDGVIQTTTDGGLHWTNVTPPIFDAKMDAPTISQPRLRLARK